MGVVLTGGTHAAGHDTILDRIGAGRRAFYSVYSLGSAAVPVTPKISSKLYQSIAMPKMTYGLEVLTTVPSHIDKLERTHNSIAKHSPNVCNVSKMAELVVNYNHSIKSYFRIGGIMFGQKLNQFCKVQVLGYKISVG